MVDKKAEADNRRTLFSRITMIFLLSVLVFLPDADLYGKTVLSVGVYNNPPTIFADDEGVAHGLFIDILEDIAVREDWELIYKFGHFSELLEELKKGTIDLLPAIAYAKERENYLDFTYGTVMANWAELYVPAGVTFTSIIELEGKRVGVKQGDIHFQVLKNMTANFNISCRFFETDEYETIFEMLQAEFVDVGVVNRLFGKRNKVHFNVVETPVIFNPIEMRYAATEGQNEEVIATIDAYLTSFKNDKSSVYYQSVSRWLEIDTHDQFPVWLSYLFYAVVGLSLLLLGVTLLFRYQVKKRTTELTTSNEHLEAQVEERKKAEENLRKYARIVEASSDAMALVDLASRHVLHNSQYLKLVPDKSGTINGATVKEVLGAEFFETELQDSVRTCLQGNVVNVHTAYFPGESEKQHWNITLSPYYANGEHIDGYVIDIRDVTQQIQLQNRLKNAQKMEAIGLLAGGVAHDLNNILSGIVSYPDMLLIDRPESDPMTKPLVTIKKSGERAAAIVQDLLTLARGGIGTIAPLNLNTIVREFLDSPEQADIIKDLKDVEFATFLDDELLNVQGSAIHLTKVLMNIFVNGVEAMPGGGVLTIATENRFLEKEIAGYELIPAGEYAVLNVNDTGVGMSRQELNRIFEPFYTSKVLGRSGTGLGMAVVWGTIKDLNGFIDIHSMQGHGSKFTLYFPVTREEVPEVDHDDLESYPGDGQRLLVIDDMAEQRHLAGRILELLGYRVETASSGKEAVELCRKKQFDLLVLDMIMPGGLGGCETYEQVAALRPGQKAIIASGFSDNSSVRRAQGLGAGAYIKKPYTVKKLARAIYRELNDVTQIVAN